MNNPQLNNSLNKANVLQASAQLKLRQSSPEIANSVYPWNNHDYDYQQFVKNNYTPTQMGISPEPCVDVTINDGLNLPNYALTALYDPIPKNSSQAGVDDVDPTNPDVTKIRNEYKKFKEPYPGFKKEYPEYFPEGLQGPYSSSYFVHTGYCPTKIKSESECTQKGYTWIPNPITLPETTSEFFPELDTLSSMGGCQKPRYTYVNNKSGDITGTLQGIAPTIGKDVLELNPVSFINIFMTGSSPTGDFTQLPCREGFTNGCQSDATNTNPTSKYKVSQYILILLLVIYITLLLIKKIKT